MGNSSAMSLCIFVNKSLSSDYSEFCNYLYILAEDRTPLTPLSGGNLLAEDRTPLTPLIRGELGCCKCMGVFGIHYKKSGQKGYNLVSRESPKLSPIGSFLKTRHLYCLWCYLVIIFSIRFNRPKGVCDELECCWHL